jgi:hypothetical protein
MRGPGGTWRALRGHVLRPSECRHRRLQKITTNFCEPLPPPPPGGWVGVCYPPHYIGRVGGSYSASSRHGIAAGTTNRHVGGGRPTGVAA